MAYSYTPAFVAYYLGAPLEEIATQLNIPLKSLQAKARQEGWRSLMMRMSERTAPDYAPSTEALDKIEANRRKNLEVACNLRDDLKTVVAALVAGTLRIKRLINGTIVECEPTPNDRLTIATYARTVFDMIYRAVGDHAANGGRKADASPESPPPAPPTTIILPAAIALPRELRGEPPARLLPAPESTPADGSGIS
jgi:hypothetical protein